MRGKSQLQMSFFYHFSCLIFETGILLETATHGLAKGAVNQIPGTYLPLRPQHWIYKPWLAFFADADDQI